MFDNELSARERGKKVAVSYHGSIQKILKAELKKPSLEFLKKAHLFLKSAIAASVFRFFRQKRDQKH